MEKSAAQRESEKLVLSHVEALVAEEHKLIDKGNLDSSEHDRLARVQVELDQCWDLLRQRRALRENGADPDAAQVRPPEVVEKYIG